jgi:hypothetical protein
MHLDGDFRRIHAGEGAAFQYGERHDGGKFNRAPGSGGEPDAQSESPCPPGRECLLSWGKLRVQGRGKAQLARPPGTKGWATYLCATGMACNILTQHTVHA